MYVVEFSYMENLRRIYMAAVTVSDPLLAMYYAYKYGYKLAMELAGNPTDASVHYLGRHRGYKQPNNRYSVSVIPKGTSPCSMVDATVKKIIVP